MEMYSEITACCSKLMRRIFTFGDTKTAVVLQKESWTLWLLIVLCHFLFFYKQVF